MLGKLSHWLLLVVLVPVLVACGGKSDPLERIEHNSGVIFRTRSVSAVTALNPVNMGLFFENSQQQVRNKTVIRTAKFTNVKQNDDRVAVIELIPSIRYTNASFSEIAFDLRTQTLPYGYNLTLYTKGSPAVKVWDMQEMMNWCLSLKDLYPKLPFTVTKDYTPPTKLAASHFWNNDSDTRVQGCPLQALAFYWIGRPMEAIKAEVAAVYNEAADPTKITLVEILERVRKNTPLLDVLKTTDPVELDMKLKLVMNEFIDAATYDFTLRVETLNLED